MLKIMCKPLFSLYCNFETKQDIETIPADLNSMRSDTSVVGFLRSERDMHETTDIE